ncbi:hypothetical protein DL89DRAFT_95121 [Linderina pennispora]|uniref:Uncharacterized protein n=1 Tax=Linderina pennispora TaxID=61395 RepID=A0A1Y1VXN5_9FUNG|nr:uncharacterized protein DL89DRAFT_95121 [Linderina pennispora]ORX65776.1 hypothetical protein DL89DRAFT_95121 [Linderina pennispora]
MLSHIGSTYARGEISSHKPGKTKDMYQYRGAKCKREWLAITTRSSILVDLKTSLAYGDPCLTAPILLPILFPNSRGGTAATLQELESPMCSRVRGCTKKILSKPGSHSSSRALSRSSTNQSPVRVLWVTW